MTVNAAKTNLDITVDECRVSFVWHDIDLRLLRADVADTGYLGMFKHQFNYTRFLQSLLAPATPPARFLPPWTVYNRNRFWTSYLSPAAALDGALLADHLTPAFVGTSSHLASDAADCALSHQAFAFPFGSVLVVHAKLTGAFALDMLVERVHALPKSAVHLIPAAGGDGAATTLQAGAQSLLAELRSLVTGGVAGSDKRIDPVTVTTVTAAHGADVKAVPPAVPTAPVAGGELHHAIWGLANWVPNWRVVSLATLTAGSRKTVPLSPECLFFQTDSGDQAIWCPDMMAGSSATPALVCYQRNMALNIVQFGSLARFIEGAADIIGAAAYNAVDYRSMLAFCMDRASDLLCRACDKSDTGIYHSGATLALLAGNTTLTTKLNAVRANVGRPACAAATTAPAPTGPAAPAKS